MANNTFRRILVGTAAGAVGSVALLPVFHHFLWSFLVGIALGVAYLIVAQPSREGYVDQLMSGAAMGIPLWGLISVVAVPVLSGEMPEWGAEQMSAHFPTLVDWVFFGASLSLLAKVFDALSVFLFGVPTESLSRDAKTTTQILVLGGGFAGMRTALCMEEEFKDDSSVAITLVSETNALLFTPMLAEVAGGSLEANHISTPLRNILRRTSFIRGRVQSIDLDRRMVQVDGRDLTYDHVILALGSVSNYFGIENAEKLAFNFKSLLDAIRIRNHVIEMFERADREPDPVVRKPLLTFVVVGGGFAGVELAGAINDFAHGILADYPKLNAAELQTILVHSRDRILPELSESLASYAQSKMEERGIQFRLDTRLTDLEPGLVVLDKDARIPAETVVWTAGTAPNPLLRSLPVERDKRGAVIVDGTMAVPGHEGVWALGDCAALADSRSGKPCPPTAQFALREAEVLSANIRAAIERRPGKPFHFDSLGALCVVGYHTACAELTLPFRRSRSVRFSGMLAWLLWRAIYLSKLPGLERKTRVLIDWAIELFCPRDIVQTIELH
jgi:NADH dehydrogenase